MSLKRWLFNQEYSSAATAAAPATHEIFEVAIVADVAGVADVGYKNIDKDVAHIRIVCMDNGFKRISYWPLEHASGKYRHLLW